MRNPRSSAFLWLSLIVLFAGCGGGGGGGGAPGGNTGVPDVTAPTVSSPSPIDNATGVAVNAAISVIFSEAMDAATITSATFTVKAGSTAVPGTVNCSGSTATFTPTGNLANSTSYTATVTTGAKDLAGNALASNYVWNFSTGTGTASVVTSLDKIDTAETTGVIDHDTALLYTMYVAYDPTSLPVEYRGDDSNVRISGTTIFFEVKQRLNSMPADLQARFRPFFLRPTDPLSIWQKHINDLNPSSAVRTLATTFEGDPWKYVDCVKTPIRVWYLAYSFVPEFEKNAKALAAEIDSSDMWWKERVSMLGHQPCTDNFYPTFLDKGGDGKLDIYLIKHSVVRNNNEWPRGTDANGLTIPEYPGIERAGIIESCPESTLILIDPLLPIEQMKITAAHELFHSFQYSLISEERGDYPSLRWWMEASATWAGDLVYPEDDSEQGRLRNGWAFNDQPDGPLDFFEHHNPRPYAAYIWPFYLSHRPGGKPEVIGELWEKSVSMTPLQAMVQRLDFPTAFKEFALWNWNKPPVQKYLDHGAPISVDNLSQFTKDVTNDWPVVAGQSPFTVDIKLEKVSVQYWHMREPVPDTGVQKLRFDLSQISNKKGAGVQAIITIGREGGQNYKQFVEDWSERGERNFCLAVENVTDIVLVVSNSDITNTLEGKIKLEVLEEGCPPWSGTFSYTNVFRTTGITRTEIWSGTVTLGHPVISIMGDETTYSLDNASATVTWDEVGGECPIHIQKTVAMGDNVLSGVPELIAEGMPDGPVFPPQRNTTFFSDGSYSLQFGGLTYMPFDWYCGDGHGWITPPSALSISPYEDDGTVTKINLIDNRMQGSITRNRTVESATSKQTLTWDLR